jgi:ribosomal-protein-alanine N-acetyltransferase
LPIRSATPADLAAMMGLERRSVAAGHWQRAQYQALFEPSAPPRFALLAEEESTLLAFLIARPLGVEWELENLVVVASARRRGLGTRLLKALFSVLRQQGGRAVFLEVRESNAAARALYQKCGFVAQGRSQRYYQEPLEDAVRYRLMLKAGPGSPPNLEP